MTPWPLNSNKKSFKFQTLDRLNCSHPCLSELCKESLPFGSTREFSIPVPHRHKYRIFHCDPMCCDPIVETTVTGHHVQRTVSAVWCNVSLTFNRDQTDPVPLKKRVSTTTVLASNDPTVWVTCMGILWRQLVSRFDLGNYKVIYDCLTQVNLLRTVDPNLKFSAINTAFKRE